MRVLLAGWFSFEQMGASAGDLMVRDVVAGWLREGGARVDVALAAPFEGGVDWREADPADYGAVVFACGPCGNGPPLTEFLDRFTGCRLVGIDLSMLDSLETWNPFDLLLERDSSRRAHPDLAFLAPERPVPVAGLVLIDSQPEYGDRDASAEANAALRTLARKAGLATVPIDTRLDENATGLPSAAAIDSLIGRMDVVLTTRLHGTVLALRHSVPPLVVDSVRGGGKVSRQARTVGWPHAFGADELQPERLEAALAACLSPEGRARAEECRRRAVEVLAGVRDEFRAWLRDLG